MHELHHIVGTCGEAHPNLFTALASAFGFTAGFLYIKYKWNQFISWFRR